MQFVQQRRLINRLLIVEDEPLVAFDSEHLLVDAGYQIVRTVDRVDHALQTIRNEPLDLVLADVQLSDGGNGIDVAREAHARGIPVLFVSGNCPLDARQYAIGCLSKPYRPRDLLGAVAAIEAQFAGKPAKRAPRGLVFY